MDKTQRISLADLKDSKKLMENAVIVDAACQAITYGGSSLEEIPHFIKKIINENRWQRRYVKHLGELIEFDSFEEFITTAPPEGMDTSIQRIKDLCQHDTKVRELINIEITKKPGAPVGNTNASKEETNHNNIMNCLDTKAVQGTSLDYTLRRLRKEAPELHAEVINKAMTPNAAAVKAGFRVTPIQLNPVDPIKAAQTVRRAIADGKIDMDYFDRFCSEVKNHG